MTTDFAPPLRDLSEARWEALAMGTLGELGWQPLEGKAIAPGSGERESWSELILPGRLRDAIARINPQLPPSAVDDALMEVTSARSRDALAENRRIHEFLTKGIRSVVYTDEHGAEHNPTIWLVDFREPEANDFLAVNQVAVVEGEHRRRFDVVLYLNGLPVGLVELKKAGDAHADLQGAYAQLRTYVDELPLAFRANVVCVVSDGITARYGTAFTPFEHFAPWNVDDEGRPVPQPPTRDEDLALNLALHGLFQQSRFLEILRGYVAFAETPGGTTKRIAKPHQYFAVSKAVGKTIEATRRDGRAGVVWHTQGSGKSLEMELYAHQVMTHPSLGNPTIVVITDRTDLDDQLYSAFLASELLPEKPVQAATRDDLRTELLNRRTGGIIFTTLQKFGRTKEEREAGQAHPLLSDRRNVIVIVDEAHRSHYDSLDGYARHLRDALPNATFVAFTGTPISEADRNTRDVFGDYIDIYDLTRAVDDGATVRVYHESRLIPVSLPKDVDPEVIDDRADQITAGLDDAERQRIQRSVAVMNAVYGAPDRLKKLAADLVSHWEARSAQMRKFIDGPGKGLIVCATRDICARLYEEIIALRPEWHADADDKGKIKVVYTGDPKDEPHIRKHVRRPSQLKVIQRRAKDPDDELELVIVQSMWLTGFDSPPLHTLYLDKPMRGAALMQALARVNRPFRAKQDGLLVGYAPVTQSLHEALAEYTQDDQDTRPVGRDIDEVVAQVRDLHDVICNVILRGYDWRGKLAAKSDKAYREAVLGTVNYLRNPALPENQVEPGEDTLAERFRKAAARLDRLYALCASSGQLNPYRDDIAFFQAVRVWMAKFDVEDRRARGLPIPAEIALYLKQLTAGIIEAGGVTDIYQAAGIDRPDLSHLDEAYLERLRASKTPHLAIEALRRAIEQTMRRVTRHNVVRQKTFSDRLIELMNRYTNQHLTSAEIIAELVAMAKEVAADADRGKAFNPPLSEDELAFYDAVAQNEAAVREMGPGVLADIARDLVRTVRNSVTVDWVSRDDVRAKLRTIIKRLLAKHGYPPDAAPAAIDLVIRQMETFAEDWSPEASR
ncbi:type I restriction endonuclease subunit R [Thermobispora bispora]|uniref:Type I restriction enzyme endonuclease subunit n=1 Tax=Thermobispora bispora (strain ATCC 19993 / DSM 43833 / CBS 139.67 / JCM 10125 / KCTC 9307 / NBRC 14880 / R51) TaxID=469371 RepID=D6Y4N4_THEBD|nr:type I restriction endonuclease subunit R [Thermobispora bispora]ADG89210.1 type I site-specific deoxyribonuclease, HsdR family [Thermobispora bispora DSM 43833]